MSNSKLKRSVLDKLKKEHGKDWKKFDPYKRQSLFGEKIQQYENYASEKQEVADRMRDREQYYGFLILAFMLGSVGGVVGNIIHEHFRQYGVIYQLITLLFVIVIIGLLVVSKKRQRKKDFEELMDLVDIDSEVTFGK